MKYEILGFSQPRLLELGLGMDEAMLLRWFVDYQSTGKMRSMEIDPVPRGDGQSYFNGIKFWFDDDTFEMLPNGTTVFRVLSLSSPSYTSTFTDRYLTDIKTALIEFPQLSRFQ